MKKLVIFEPYFGKGETSTDKVIKIFEGPSQLGKIINKYGEWGEVDCDLSEESLDDLATEGGSFTISTPGGDWDDATGYYVTVISKDSYIEMLKETLEREIEYINELYNA